MTPTSTGWTLLIAAIGMMLGMVAVDITTLMNWSEVFKPVFVGTMFGHLAAVIAAFVGGKLIPPNRDETLRTRSTDK